MRLLEDMMHLSECHFRPRKYLSFVGFIEKTTDRV